MKKETTGVSGAARIYQMTRADLTRAEKHGKRLDVTGRSRAINNDPPVTTTGLELNALFGTHIAGAFVPKAHSKAMHVLIQFPTDLVDGNDADGMLHHARGFTRRVFGEEAIFADRVDRDEKSRHVVDLFVAPRYIKTTKHQSKVAVSMTHHLKALAEEYGEKTGPHGCARALQTALFEYLRDEMGLEGVVRGSPKAVPGPDWKSSEQQRSEELDDRAAKVQAQGEQVERDQAAASADRADAAATRSAVDAHARSITDDRRALDQDREALDRRSAELARRERQVRETEDSLRAARAELQRQQDDVTTASAAATRATEIARNEAIAATKALVAAEADRDSAMRLVKQAESDRAAIAIERGWREGELALLMRASDDANGLHLRPVDTGIAMNEVAMNDAERATFRRPWPAPVRLLALKLAKALEQVRGMARRFREREERLNADEAAMRRQEQANARMLEEGRAAQRAEHDQALAALKVRRDAAAVAATEAERRASAAETRMTTAIRKEEAATTIVAEQEHWAKAVDMIGRYPSLLLHDDDGSFRLDQRPERTGRLPDWLVTTFRKPAPAWATVAIRRLHQLEIATERVETRERQAAHHLELLQDIVATAGSALQPAQQAVVDQADRLVRRVRAGLYPGDRGQSM